MNDRRRGPYSRPGRATPGGGPPARGIGLPMEMRELGPQMGSQPAGDPPSLYRLPVDVHPPTDAQNITIAGALLTTSPINAQVATFDLSSGRAGVIRQIDLTVTGTLLATTDARWTVEIAGSPDPMVRDFPMPAVQGTTVTVSLDSTSTFLRLPAGAEVRILARSPGGVPLTFSCRLSGWSWGLG